MQESKMITTETEKNEAESIIKWIDGLAKIIVVITALLYIVGRSYTESYYAHMGIPTSNLPLTFQEHLFMSTRSLSFLKSAVSASLISVITGFLLSFAIGGVETIWKTLIDRFTKKGVRIKREEVDSSNPESADTKKDNAKTEVEFSEKAKEPKKPADDKNKILEFQSKIKDWLKDKLIYIVPTFIVLVFFMLITFGAS